MNNSENRCDLHVHSSFSDGVYSPAKLIEMAAEKRLSAISVTDHDTVEGQQEALETGFRYDIEVVPGVEISVKIEGKEIHILGYLIDYENSVMLDELDGLKRHRENRARKIVDKLYQLGIEVPYREVGEIAGEGAVGRPHIARALVQRGVVETQQEAFNRFIGYRSSAYVPRKVLSVERVSGIIMAAGGIPVWAHPGRDISNRKIRERIIASEVRGVEVWHPNHGRETRQAIEEFARRNDMIITGGSDFHSDETMKAGIGELPVCYSSVMALKHEQVLLNSKGQG